MFVQLRSNSVVETLDTVHSGGVVPPSLSTRIIALLPYLLATFVAADGAVNTISMPITAELEDAQVASTVVSLGVLNSVSKLPLASLIFQSSVKSVIVNPAVVLIPNAP